MMTPAADAAVDYKSLVARGYDQCAGAYASARRQEAAAELDLLAPYLRPRADVLDIGCGGGIPVAATLARRFNARVIGVDISAEQVWLARTQVPGATFIHSDIMAVAFPARAFDAVVCFYALFHLPRRQHAELLRRAHGWLKPGGCLLVTVAGEAEPGYTEADFFGATMYWSHYGLDDYRRMLAEIGFRVLATETLGHGYQAGAGEAHPLLLARAEAR
jgi:cyclopropane fatty-acyl-phospholipid synthase-like methyltransferase